MQTFEHSSFIGDFFTVLHAKDEAPLPEEGECTFATGYTHKQEAALLLCSGDFSIKHAPRLAASLEALLTGTVQLVVLDFSRARIFSANAAAVLANFMAGVRGRGKECIIFNPSQPVRTMLRALDLGHLFTIRQTEEELLLDIPDQPLS